MKRSIVLCLTLIVLSGCSRNGEYRYMSQLNLIEPAETLLPKVTQRLKASEFRKNYDQTLVDRIGSSFKNFKHIRAYQAVLEDALIYMLLKTNSKHFDDGLRNALIHPTSKLILSHRSGDDLLTGLDTMVKIMKENKGEARIEALSAYDMQIKPEDG